MKAAIFGTGKVFNQYWQYIDKNNVVCFVDNNKEKTGKYIDDIEIILPEQLKEFEYDVILLLVLDKFYDEIKCQLLELGVSKDKILHLTQIGIVSRKPMQIYRNDGIYTFDEWKRQHEGKKVLLIAHQLSLTGAPIALMNMAKVLRKMGVSVLFAGWDEGSLQEELKVNHIDCVPNWQYIDGRQYLEEVDLVVICSFAMRRLVKGYKYIKTPIIWWIHETEASYREVEFLEYGENVSIYCGGNHAYRAFQAHYKNINAGVLQYCIPQQPMMEDKSRMQQQDKITFGVIGTFCNRKGQDILLHAVLKLSTDYREKIKVLIIGSATGVSPVYWEEQEPLLEQLNNVTVLGEMLQDELAEKYKEIDVLVCPSRADPMPMVVTQAMMYGKTCILSENVGQSEFVISGENGFVFADEDELAEQIRWAVDNREKLYDIGKCARAIYDENFSDAIMEKKLTEFWQEMEGRG